MNQGMLQAIREKEVAEKKMISSDFASARDHLLKAYKLYPAFDDIISMLTLCDILTASRVELPGCGVDYYWVLQVMPSSTLADIRSQYQKLVCLLQPIRTKFPCVESAIELLQAAFKVLRDQKQRVEFDLKRVTNWEKYKSFDLQPSSCQSSVNKVSAGSSKSSSALEDSLSLKCDKGSKSAEMVPKNIATFAENQVNLENMHKQRAKMIIEELNLFNLESGQNNQVEVDKYAASVNIPATLHPSSLEDNLCSSSKVPQQKRHFQDFHNFDNDRKFQHFEAGQVWAVNYRGNERHNYRYAQIDSSTKAATTVTWLKPIPVTSSERRWCDAGLPAACGSFEVSSDMQIEVRWHMIAYYKCSWIHGVTKEQFEIYPKKGEIWAVYKDWNLDDWSYNPDSMNGCKFELVEIISDYSRYAGTYGVCLVKVDGFTSVFERQAIGGNPVTFHIPPSNLYIFSHNVLAYRFKGGELHKVAEGMFELDQWALPLPDYMIQETSTQKKQMPNKGKSPALTLTDELPSFKSISENKVLMPSWSQKDFLPGQVWAVYWGKDLMPRKYVRIKNVISENRVYVTFLEPVPVLDHEIEWVRQDLPMVYGMFKLGGSTNIELSLFSHPVECEENTSKSCYKIYPLKGEVWAMYKGWNIKWKLAECQIVQILSDFSQDGIKISRLEEVKGYLTFFKVQEYDGFDLVNGVSKAEMLGFSHRIPAFKVPGIGKYGIPDDSWHLEPLALPSKRGN